MRDGGQEAEHFDFVYFMLANKNNIQNHLNNTRKIRKIGHVLSEET